MTGPHAHRTLRWRGVELAAASFVVLFQELAFIRALPAQVRVLAYFPNLILISAFLGLGVGALLASRKSLLWLWVPITFFTLSVSAVLGQVAFTAGGTSEYLWLLYFDLPGDAPVVRSVGLPIVLFFVLSAVTFVPLGQLVASRLQDFREAGIPLWGYALDLGGSLLGVVGFAVVSFLGAPPAVWFGTFLVAALVLVVPRRRLIPIHLVVAPLVLLAVIRGERAHHYSPYYAIAFHQGTDARSFAILTNGSLHQAGWPMARADEAVDLENARHREGLHLPLELLGRPPGRTLVLGAGNGNDVAVLLDRGAERVDAVEIDPVILELGRTHHPDRPYDSPAVRRINTDARSYLNHTGEEYDLIVFGTLDSMTRLSALSSVRLDNFVYTREGIRAARDRLGPEGGLVLFFSVGQDHIRRHLVALLTEVFGRPPLVREGNYAMLNLILMTGPAFDHLRPEAANGPSAAPHLAEATFDGGLVPTDDWPYLYLPGRGVSSFYVGLIGVLLLISVLAVAGAAPSMVRGLGRRGGMDVEMFLYGVAFLLLETRFITEMSLVWGATWLTSAVVFGSILALILVATVTMQLRPLPFRISFVGLVASLLVIYLVPTESLLSPVAAVRLGLSVVYVGVPVFFAAACFAARFRERTNVDLAFGWNLLGAVVGGFVEFLSMAVGFKALVLVVVAAYLGSLFGLRGERGTTGPGRLDPARA